MVHPVSHAVGNTVKRVVLIVFSVLRCCGPCIVSDRHDAPITRDTMDAGSVRARPFVPRLRAYSLRFGTPMNGQTIVGSTIAVTGVFAFSVAKQRVKPKTA